jgi:hypothetical protein
VGGGGDVEDTSDPSVDSGATISFPAGEPIIYINVSGTAIGWGVNHRGPEDIEVIV